MNQNEWYVLDDETKIHRSQLPLFDLAIKKPNPTLTVVAVTDDYKLEEHVEAIKRTATAIPFKVEQLLVSSNQPEEFSGTWIRLPKRFGDKGTYSEYMIRSLPDLIQTDFCLTVQWDSYATRSDAWSNDFLKYDYVGAPFTRHPVFKYLFPKSCRRINNSAFSLRSSRWLLLGKAAKGLEREMEDMFCTQKTVKHWLKHDCRIAPMDIAIRFSDKWCVSNGERQHSFNFHGVMPDSLKHYTEWPSYSKLVFQLGRFFLKQQMKAQ